MSDCTPNFIPGPIGCVMPSLNETKSRLKIGGSFFRSLIPGLGANNIEIQSVWYVCIAGGSPPCALIASNLREYDDLIDDICDVIAVELRIFVDGIQTTSPLVAQSLDCTDDLNPVWMSGIPELRLILENGSPTYTITMPETDIIASWQFDDVFNGDADHLAEFVKTSLMGATGINQSPTQTDLDAIRTGPAFTLTNIGQSEKNTNDGSMENINDVRYWNGNCWKIFDSVNIPISCDSDSTCP